MLEARTGQGFTTHPRWGDRAGTVADWQEDARSASDGYRAPETQPSARPRVKPVPKESEAKTVKTAPQDARKAENPTEHAGHSAQEERPGTNRGASPTSEANPSEAKAERPQSKIQPTNADASQTAVTSKRPKVRRERPRIRPADHDAAADLPAAKPATQPIAKRALSSKRTPPKP